MSSARRYARVVAHAGFTSPRQPPRRISVRRPKRQLASTSRQPPVRLEPVHSRRRSPKSAVCSRNGTAIGSLHSRRTARLAASPSLAGKRARATRERTASASFPAHGTFPLAEAGKGRALLWRAGSTRGWPAASCGAGRLELRLGESVSHTPAPPAPTRCRCRVMDVVAN